MALFQTVSNLKGGELTVIYVDRVGTIHHLLELKRNGMLHLWPTGDSLETKQNTCYPFLSVWGLRAGSFQICGLPFVP